MKPVGVSDRICQTGSMILYAAALVATMAMIPLIAIASSNSENVNKEEHLLLKVSKENRGPINYNFAPDESCDLNAYRLKCIPGSEQECSIFIINKEVDQLKGDYALVYESLKFIQ